uniref:Epidermal patterning factor-like protein n=1 Tax=Kalanchoe fedtschenkoi TaxID=63787 RepID=A0A7N0UQJ4_KALFE
MTSLSASEVFLRVALLLVAVLTINALRLPPDSHRSSLVRISSKQVQVHLHVHPKESEGEDLGVELFPTGSSLPDCTHACGACNPCKRVMVSFECSIAESCPVVYRCICKGKYYHVPSN